MKHLRYYAEFYDAEGILYRVEIHQESETAYTPQEVVLAADPVMIEWNEVSKIDPLQGSGATLRLVSMTDRQFIDLYAVEPKAIRMDVYRAGALYWSGTLDTELYQEPYSFKERYITEVTFSDFGVLDRLLWEQHGWMTIGEVVNHCVEATGISYTVIDKYIATTVPSMSGTVMTDCTISADNFYDEDGEAWSIKEVLEEVLRPFALQIRQKNGKVIITDTHSLSSVAPQQVEWRDSGTQLGVEPVYNRAKITYSPYSQAELFNGDFKEEDILPNAIQGKIIDYKIPLPDTDYTGFVLRVGEKITEPTEVQGLTVHNQTRLFRTMPENSGSENAGVLWGYRTQSDVWVGNAPVNANAWIGIDSWKPLMQTPRLPIRNGSGYYNIKVSLDTLFDPRRNPFESGSYNYDDVWEEFRTKINFFAVQCSLVLYASDGKVYSYDNSDLWNFLVGDSVNFQQQYFANSGKWVEGAGGVLLLTYYNETDRKKDTGIGGWATNKQNVGRWTGEIPKNITLNIDGEKIPAPNKIGDIQLTVYRGARFLSSNLNDVDQFNYASQVLRWQLYKDLRIEVVTQSGKSIDVEEIEVSAWINKDAKEEIDIDTYIGSMITRTPMACGAILRTDMSDAITSFTRAGVTDSLEKLLVGTVYSNYAARKNTLEGTIKLLPESLVLSDNSDVNGRYVILSSNENLQQATAEVRIAEFSADEYSDIEYE